VEIFPMAPPWHTIKALLTHSYFLILILVSSFLAFTFHPGALVDIMRMGYAFAIVYLAAGRNPFGCMTRGHLVLFAIMLIVLLLNLTVPPNQIHSSTLSNFIAVPGLVLICHLLGSHSDKVAALVLKRIGLATLTIAVTGQLVILVISHGTDAIYDNIHHLGLFAGICISVAGYFTITLRHFGRWSAFITGLMALYLLWESNSRISWLAFCLSATLTLIALPDKKQMLIVFIIVASAAGITAGLSGYENICLRLDDMMNGWRSEERVYIWRDAAELLRHNTIMEWLRGRGIGSFRYFIKDYPGLSVQKLETLPTFPHNIGIQVLFENGLIGLILVFSGLGAMVRQLWLGIRRDSSTAGAGYLYMVCFSVFGLLFFHTLLTKSIYSKYITYLFSMVAGITFTLEQKTGRSKMLAQIFPSVFSKIGHP
jgi:O-antigen ligase